MKAAIPLPRARGIQSEGGGCVLAAKERRDRRVESPFLRSMRTFAAKVQINPIQAFFHLALSSTW